MEEDVLEGMMGNRFLVFLVKEDAYPGNILDIATAAGKHHRKICYVCK